MRRIRVKILVVYVVHVKLKKKKRPDLVEKKKHIYLNDIPFFDQIIFLGCSNSSLFLESELRPQ